MRIRLIAVGRIGSGPESDLCDDYLKRARKTWAQIGVSAVEIEDFRESRRDDAGSRMSEEADTILARISDKSRLIVLDERGKTPSSRDFANMISRFAEEGADEVIFAIGGPDGHGDAVKKRADAMISFGAMTLPHKLLRAVLAEQIYRAGTILTNHPYHRD